MYSTEKISLLPAGNLGAKAAFFQLLNNSVPNPHLMKHILPSLGKLV
jgi:hypothetical protein